MNGVFISFEGTEGCGKSTQVRLLAERLLAAGWRVRSLREPGGTPLAEEVRHLLKHSPAGKGMSAEAELLLMNAARAQLVREVIRPALAAGEVVLCDRFADSTTAYQGWGRGLDPASVAGVVQFAIGETRPDLTLLLRAPAAESARRRRERARAEGLPTDRFEAEDEAFFARVEAGFSALAAAAPERVRGIDAGGPIASVADAIWEVVVGRFPWLTEAGPK